MELLRRGTTADVGIGRRFRPIAESTDHVNRHAVVDLSSPSPGPVVGAGSDLRTAVVMRIARSQADRLVSWVLIAAGLVTLVMGWLYASGTPYPSAELPGVISGGAGGLYLLGLGSALLVGADLRDEWRKLDDLEEEIDAFENEVGR